MTYTRRFTASVARRRAGSRRDFWVTLGKAFERPDGKIAVLLDALPTGDWDGQFFLFPDTSAPATPAPATTELALPKPPLPAPKVHQQSMTEPGAGVCGHYAREKNRTEDWSRVTCKHCLRQRPEE